MSNTLSSEDIKERIALSCIKGMTAELALKIKDVFGDLHTFYSFDVECLNTIPEAGPALHDLMQSRNSAMSIADDEFKFVCKHNIKVLSIVDEDRYPRRLYNCPDAPVNLFVLGDTDFNADSVLSVVGTRKPTPYGLAYTSKFVDELAEFLGDMTVVSGLAYGIDKAAHEAALRNQLPTIAVVAHGLGMIYPAMHRQLTSVIIKAGGAIVSEYLHGVKPFRGHFLERNRIVAGLSDAVFVVESGVKGGALNTAAHARNYNREVFALPGRVSDELSQGCNKLIANQLALLASRSEDIVKAVGWQTRDKEPKVNNQLTLFDSYEGSVKKVYDFLKNQLEPCTVDRIVANTALTAKDVMSALGEIDLDGLLARLPGAKYSLI